MIRILPSTKVGPLLTRRAARMIEAETAVRPILDAVRKRGDKAVIEYARKFDGLRGNQVEVPAAVLRKARLTPELRRAVLAASRNIRAYAQLQLPTAKTLTPMPGVKLSQVVRPLDCVAAYIPSGRYPLPSTLMMTVIPAQVAAWGRSARRRRSLRT
jgi:histidinol dehydrogenase